MATGITNLGYKTVYYNSNGQMEFGEKKISGHWYYFRPGNGSMATGFVNLGNKTVYYSNNGQMVFHDFDLNGIHYEVNPSDGSVKAASYKHGQIPTFKQADPRWANVRIGGFTIARTGCVPTSLAMGISAITYSTVTPPTVAQYLYNNSDTYNKIEHGGCGKAAQVAANHWNVRWQGISSAGELSSALSQGKIVMMLVGPGTFTVPGASHAILLSGNNRGTTYVYDPDNYGGNGYYNINSIWNQRSGVSYDWYGGYISYALYR